MTEHTLLGLTPGEWEAIGIWVGSIFAAAAFFFLLLDQRTSRNAILHLSRLAKAEENKQIAFFQIVKESERRIGNSIQIQLINKGARAIHTFVFSRNPSLFSVSYSPCFDNNIEPNAIIQLIIKTYDGSPVPQLNRGADISFMDMNNKRYKQIFVHLDGGLSSITAPSPEDTSDKKKSTSRLKSFLKKNLGFNQ